MIAQHIPIPQDDGTYETIFVHPRMLVLAGMAVIGLVIWWHNRNG